MKNNWLIFFLLISFLLISSGNAFYKITLMNQHLQLELKMLDCKKQQTFYTDPQVLNLLFQKFSSQAIKLISFLKTNIAIFFECFYRKKYIFFLLIFLLICFLSQLPYQHGSEIKNKFPIIENVRGLFSIHVAYKKHSMAV